MKIHPHVGKTLLLQLVVAALALGMARADVFTVMNTNDNGPGSLRETLVLASSDSDHTVLFDPSLDGATITLATGNLFTVRDPLTSLDIDASNLQNGITVDANAESRHLVQIGDGASLTITGMNFVNGRGPDGGGNDGGSIIAASSLTLIQCSFADNRAGDGTEIHPAGGNGGAVYCEKFVLCSSCRFENNRAGDGFTSLDGEGGRGGDGGAVFSENAFEGGLTFFANNRAGDGGSSKAADENAGRGGDGGAVHFSESSFFGISKSEFVGNRAGDGGGHSGDEFGGPGGAGGALYVGNGIQINDATFIRNYAGRGGSSHSGRNGGGGRGGAIVHFGGALHLQNAILHRNEAGDPGDGAGAADGFSGDGGAIFSIPVVDGSLDLTNCIVSENKRTAVILFGGEGTIGSSTIVGNSDPDSDSPALFVSGDASLTLRNSILGGNIAGPNGAVLNKQAFAGAEIIEEGINFDGTTIPVDLAPDPLGANGNRFGVPLPGQSQIVDRIALPAPDLLSEDIRGGRRPFGGLADLGAVEAEYRPDLTIGKSSDPAAMIGENIYAVSSNDQKIAVRQKGRQKKSSFIAAGNDGDIDNLVLRGKIKHRGLKVKVMSLSRNAGNVTGAIARGGYSTNNLRNGESALFRIITKKKGKDRRVRKNMSFDLSSSSPSVTPDYGKIRVVARD